MWGTDAPQPPIDVFGHDFGEALPPEREAGLQNPLIVVQRSGPGAFLTLSEKTDTRFIPSHALRPTLAQDALGEEATRLGPRLRQAHGRVSPNRNELSIKAMLHNKCPRPSLGDAAAEGAQRLIEVDALALLRRGKLPNRDIRQAHEQFLASA